MKILESFEASGIDLDQFLKWFLGSESSNKTSTLLRSIGTHCWFGLYRATQQRQCKFPPELRWNRIDGGFYLEIRLICCRKGWVKVKQHTCHRAWTEAVLVAAKSASSCMPGSSVELALFYFPQPSPLLENTCIL